METGAAIGIGGLLLSGVGLVQSSKANSENSKLAQEQMKLQKIKDTAQLEGQLADYDLSITEARSQVDSYDKWLGNYQNQYDQQVASRNAQTEALKASGQEAYDNFMNAIGYSDALAGATGRAGGGTSAGAATKAVDAQLVSYVGEDRTLDPYGGLFGAQLNAANLELGQMKADLELQKYEAEQNRDIAFQSIAHYEEAKTRTQDTISQLNAAPAAPKPAGASGVSTLNKVSRAFRKRH